MRHTCTALCNEGGVQAVRLRLRHVGTVGTVAALALAGLVPAEPGVPGDGRSVSAEGQGGCHGHARQACASKKPH